MSRFGVRRQSAGAWPRLALAVELWDRADILVSSQLVYLVTLEELYSQLRTVAIDEPLARHAGGLAAHHGLRGYDAVHLACALQLHGDDILLATWDDALNAAARAPGQLLANDTA